MTQPLVFVHGWMTSAAVWRSTRASLEPEFEIVAVDLPGFGGSPPPSNPSAPDHAAALRSMVESQDLVGIVLIGWSLGGLVVLEYIERFGTDGVAGVVIVDVSPRAREASDWPAELAVGAGFSEGLSRWVAMWGRERDEVLAEHSALALSRPAVQGDLVAELEREGALADSETALGTLRTYAELDFRPVLPRIDVPVLLVFGGRSQSTTDWVADYMCNAIPEARLARFDDAGHAVMLEAPERFADAIREFACSL